MQDFRSDKMETREGKGIAKRAWDAYFKGAERTVGPLVAPLLGSYTVNKAVDLSGFWLCWHLHGGFEGLQKLGMSERTIFRNVAWFRRAYGEHPDAFEFPGVTLDPKAYMAAKPKPRKPRG